MSASIELFHIFAIAEFFYAMHNLAFDFIRDTGYAPTTAYRIISILWQCKCTQMKVRISRSVRITTTLNSSWLQIYHSH